MKSKKKPQDTSLVGTRSMKNKETLLQSGAIFVFTTQDMYYIVSQELEEVRCEIFYYDEDYVNIHEVCYPSLSVLEVQEPFLLAKFSIVYLLEARGSSASQGVSRSDILQRVKGYAGLEWSVININPYALPEAHYELSWQAWLCTLSRPLWGRVGQEEIRFLLAVFNGQDWLVLTPKALHVPALGSIESVKCEFFVPGHKDIETWKEQEQSEGKPI